MSRRSDQGSSRSARQGSASADLTFGQIRERAYDLWERHHRPEDSSIALWLMAERELRAEQAERDARLPPTDTPAAPPPEGPAEAPPDKTPA